MARLKNIAHFRPKLIENNGVFRLHRSENDDWADPAGIGT
jgi:hypothetical protein